MRRFYLLAALLIGLGSLPQSGYAALWTSLPAAQKSQNPDSARFAADEAALRAWLSLAPHEILLDRSFDIELPMPDGSLQKFSIVESPIMPLGFGERFADMKTFKVRGIDDPTITGRADLTVKGFRAMLSTGDGPVFIDPESAGNNLYRSARRDPAAAGGFVCGVHGNQQSPVGHVHPAARPSNRLAMNYQTYRIAVSATWEYVAAVGGSNAAAQAEILTAINRVNEIYERDLGIRLLLVANDGGLLEDSNDECFSNDEQELMLLENQVWTDFRIGKSAYDIGHVFASSNGGIAFLGAACQDDIKAGGVSGQPNPTGNPFYVDYVAHEIGHQLNAEHIFNGTTGACGGGNRNAATAFEPGSGSTIMGYAGICGGENLQLNSDATFHAASIAQIDSYTAGGGSCYGTVANGNNDPVITPHGNRNIPVDTPFRLSVAAADIDLDTLTYQWDQMDSGDATSISTFGLDLGNNPLFRTYAPQADNFRDFPALGTQLLGQTDDAEVLPANARTLDFRTTVRDGNSGQDSDDFRLTVVASNAFRVTSPNGGTLDTSGGAVAVTWDPASTGGGTTINCANVDIELLTFSDAAYTQYAVHTLLLGTTNDGSEAVTATMSHTRARVRIKCSDNVFYDISDADVNVIGTSATPYPDMDFTTFFNSNGLTVSRGAKTGGGLIDPFAGSGSRTAARFENCPTRSSGSDASAIEPWWLACLAGLVALLRIFRRYGLQ